MRDIHRLLMRVEAWLLYSLMAILLWGTWGFVSKIVLERASWASIIIYNMLGTFIIFTTYMYSQGFPKPAVGTTALIALLSGILGAAGTVCFMLSLSIGRPSITVPLTALYPVVTAVLSVIFLGDQLSPRHVAGISFAVMAIFLLSYE